MKIEKNLYGWPDGTIRKTSADGKKIEIKLDKPADMKQFSRNELRERSGSANTNKNYGKLDLQPEQSGGISIDKSEELDIARHHQGISPRRRYKKQGYNSNINSTRQDRLKVDRREERDEKYRQAA